MSIPIIHTKALTTADFRTEGAAPRCSPQEIDKRIAVFSSMLREIKHVESHLGEITDSAHQETLSNAQNFLQRHLTNFKKVLVEKGERDPSLEPAVRAMQAMVRTHANAMAHMLGKPIIPVIRDTVSPLTVNDFKAESDSSRCSPAEKERRISVFSSILDEIKRVESHLREIRDPAHLEALRNSQGLLETHLDRLKKVLAERGETDPSVEPAIRTIQAEIRAHTSVIQHMLGRRLD